MKRATIVIFTVLLALGMTGGAALAGNHDDDHREDLPQHPHVLLLNVDITEEGVTYDRCVDLAGNNALRLNAHHHSVHMGTAGEALFEHAGHLVVPMRPFPLLPFDWESCDDIPSVIPPPPE